MADVLRPGAFARRPPRTWARLPTHVFSGAGLQRDRALAPGDGPRSLSPDVSVTGAGGRALWAHTRSDLLLSRPSCPDSGLSVKTPSHRRPRAAKSLLPVLECTVPLLWSQTNTQYGGGQMSQAKEKGWTTVPLKCRSATGARTRMCTRTRVYTRVYTHARIHIHTCTCTHACTKHMYACAPAMHTQTHAHTKHVRTCMHKHTRTHSHPRTHPVCRLF